MTIELQWMTLSALALALYWMPYVLNRMVLQGVFGAMLNPSPEDPRPPAWAVRAKAAHGIAVENFPIFSALILAIQVTGLNSSVTATAAAAYFYGMLVHYLAFTLGIPVLRTIAFLMAGFAVEVVLALTLPGMI